MAKSATIYLRELDEDGRTCISSSSETGQSFAASIWGSWGPYLVVGFQHGHVAAVSGTTRQLGKMIANGLFAKVPIQHIGVSNVFVPFECDERPTRRGEPRPDYERRCVRRKGSLPIQVYELLRGEEFTTARRGKAKSYATHEDAQDDISRAYVAFGRKAVGLPLIE